MHSSSSSPASLINYSEPEPDSKRPKNDVFMNYSEDIGKQFISHLKGALKRNGFTISDHTILPVGQDTRLQLLKALEESEIYVVVFSTNYASSVRSLDELVDIMGCLGKSDQRKIFPVFYKIEPSDIRSQQGSFKKAFLAHEADEDIDSVRVQKWKQALRDAGQLSGLPLQNGDEGKFVSKIVKELECMQSPQELQVADHPVMIGSRVKELISTLRLDCEDVLVVAVFGISGIGKTTIVRATYNKISSYFDVSCFLGISGGQIELQNLLISCLTHNYYKFPRMHHHNDGVTKIRNLIRGRKVLLVLDDVDNFEQLKSLGINPASFYKGSRIIVITRDKQSLGFIPYTSYHTKKLNGWESFNLFNRLMFSRDNDLVNMKFIEEVAALAGGIPLVVEVWSRYFIGHERKQWPSLLEKLKRIPHEDVQKKLQMSYDSLSVTAKNLFLDIACFFEGYGKGLVVDVLHDEELGFFPDVEIQGLVDKFLVKYTDKYFLWLGMNQVIKEMGQEVVRQENPEEPGQRTRLMGRRDVVRVLRENLGTDSVRSIRLDYNDKMEKDATVQLEALKKMSNLRFIRLNSPNLQWSCCSNDDDKSACFSFKHLKYLEWHYYPCKSLDNFDMGNVVVIKLIGSKLERLWEGANKSLKKLKILNVRDSSSLIKTGSFIGLDNLEVLDLSGCSNLKELDSSIGCLQKLVTLNLSGCKRLKRLPWKITGKLASKNVNLEKCTNISNKVGCLKSLLSSKNKFNSHHNSRCQLHQLTSIFLSRCAKLKSIPNLPPNIETLYAVGCSNLENLPSNISELQNLKELSLDGCLKLGSEGFTQVTELRNLETLWMNNCNVSQVSSEIGNLVSLRELHLSRNTFSSLPESFNNLSKLEHLYINKCSELQLLPPLPPQLTKIEAKNSGSLDVMRVDSTQKAHIFPSNPFKESRLSSIGLHISLSGEEVPEWCTYNVLSFVAPIQFDHSKICGIILCAIRVMVMEGQYESWYSPVIFNKTKGTSHRCAYGEDGYATMLVMFYPLNDKTLVVEAGDTVELQFDRFKSIGVRLVYEDDVVDSRLVLKDVRDQPTVSC